MSTPPSSRPPLFMLIAGEISGDALAAELVQALRDTPVVRAGPFAPRFFGAGGPRMSEAGVELALDLTRHSVVGFSEVLRHYRKFRRFLHELMQLALARQPDVIIGVDFSGFNRRLLHALRHHLDRHRRLFENWRPRLVQYVSPQVWASRPGRASGLARDLDLLLCLFPFEQAWYRRHAPKLHVEFVGHPLVDRHADIQPGVDSGSPAGIATGSAGSSGGKILLLPGSRASEIRRHLPVMLRAVQELAATDAVQVGTQAPHSPLRFTVVFPDASLRAQAQTMCARMVPGLELRTGGLAEALAQATVAIASTGTVTLECAWFRVPTVALYKTSWPTYLIARQMVSVPHLAMPNLLAGEELFPEFIQHRANPKNLAGAVRKLLADVEHRREVRTRLSQLQQQLGPPGAAARAAAAVARLLVD